MASRSTIRQSPFPPHPTTPPPPHENYSTSPIHHISMSPQRRKYQVLVRSRGSLHTPARRLHRSDLTGSFCSLDDDSHETPRTTTCPHATKLFQEPRNSKPSNRNDLSPSSREAQPPDFFDLYPSSDQGSCSVNDLDRRPVIVADGHLRDKTIKALYGGMGFLSPSYRGGGRSLT